MLGRVEGARRNAGEIDGFFREIPADVGGVDELDGPGAEPAARAGDGGLAGIGVTWRKGLEDMEVRPIAHDPGHER